MDSPTKQVQFVGLDPAPISVTIAADASDEAIFAAACVPSSLFIQTVRPYRLQETGADTYELVLGPEGYGGVLLEALRWLARITAAGIVDAVARERVAAFVQHCLERDRPEWRFEELTEHAAAFIDDRYQRVTSDTTYRQTLEAQRHEPTLTAAVTELQTWMSQASV